MVADHQPVSRDVGAERLPSGVSSVPQLRARGPLSENRRHETRSLGRSFVRSSGSGPNDLTTGHRLTDDRTTDRIMKLTIAFAAVLALAPAVSSSQQKSPGAGPVIVLETAKGTIEFETYPEEAPKTVAHIVELVKKSFYNGQRFHRAEPNFVDPDRRSGDARHVSRQAWWGRGSSGKPIGVAEITKKRRHGPGRGRRWRYAGHRQGRRRQPVLHHCCAPRPSSTASTPCSAR